MKNELTPRIHGGPDGATAARIDASTNVNPLGPAPQALAAVGQACRQRYPDPHYTALRGRLAALQGVAAARIAVTAGGSEGIFRLTLAARLAGVAQVAAPQPGYGDYAAAAQAAGLPLRPWRDLPELLALASARSASAAPTLLWVNDPANPSGAALDAAQWRALGQALHPGVHLAIDQAYAPLHLLGGQALPQAIAERAWQVFTPNKALGLPGVRAGWLQAPAAVDGEAAAADLWLRVQAQAPSWVLSSEGVALLEAWCAPGTQAWLADGLPTLAAWRAGLVQSLAARGWTLAPGASTFVLGRPPAEAPAVIDRLQRLRAQGIALRDCQSFGLPGWVRVGLRAPAEQAQWLQAWDALAACDVNPHALEAAQ